jgi:hypothetical protein
LRQIGTAISKASRKRTSAAERMMTMERRDMGEESTKFQVLNSKRKRSYRLSVIGYQLSVIGEEKRGRTLNIEH